MEKIKKIITHHGNAHRDDLYASAIALAKFGFVSVYRRDPTLEELEDPEVLVLDTGMRHEPDKRNFDHHQFSRDAKPECALSLFLKYLDIEKWFELQPWYRTLVTADAKGPFTAARELGLEEIPQALYSPIEGGLLEVFGSRSSFEEGNQWYNTYEDCEKCGEPSYEDYVDCAEDDPFLGELHTIGTRLLATAQSLYDEYNDSLRKIEVIHLKGLPGLWIKEQINPLVIRTIRNRECDNKIAFSITPSNREGEGWVLYRYDDHPRIDFNRLKDFYNHRLKFIHANGFIAKTIEGLPFISVLELMETAIGRGG